MGPVTYPWTLIPRSLRMSVNGCSIVQVSAGWPNDDKEDMDMPIWAGVIPLTQVGNRTFNLNKSNANTSCQSFVATA